MVPIRLRAVRDDDLPVLSRLESAGPDEDSFNFFGFRATNGLARRFAENGAITEDAGMLVVTDGDGNIAGQVNWFAIYHRSGLVGRAFNIGIALLPECRGRGLGTSAQHAFAEYLFANTTVERLEAGTEADNRAEQIALVRAGFHYEGRSRHTHFRAGQWRDDLQYSRLRSDPAPA